MSRESRPWWATGRLWGALAGVAVLILVIAYLSGMFHDKVEPGTVTDRSAAAVPGDAPLVTVRAETYHPVVEIVGTVASVERVRLSSRLNAYVRSVEVGAGDRVRKGQILAELDDRELRQQLLSAQADLARADADYQRTLELHRNEAATRRELDVAEASFRGAEARVEEIQVLLSHARISSPMDGVVVDRGVEVGDLATVGSELFTVYDPGRMRLEAPVPLRLAGKLQLGDEVDALLGDSPQRVTGTIQEVVAAIDPRSRTRLVKVLLPRSAGRLYPGTFGRLLLSGDPRLAIFVPETSVYQVGQLRMVQVAEAGRLVRRAVRVGRSRDGQTEILAGLAEGETILETSLPGEE
jgi:RND family efflux transporter MFP subunit